MFDLPMETAQERRNYRRYVKFLKKEGFFMLQKSVYTKLVINEAYLQSERKRLLNNKPSDGIVSVLTITEKQFQEIEHIVGSIQHDVIDIANFPRTMRRITLRNIETSIVFDKGLFFSIVFEDPPYGYRFVSNIARQLDSIEDGPVIYSEGDTIKDASKKIILITDLYRFDAYDKSIHSALQKYALRVSSQCDITSEMNRLGEAYVCAMEKIVHESVIPFEYDAEIDCSSLVKVANVRVDKQHSDLLESLIQYLDVLTSLLGIDIFIIVGLKQYLTQYQLEIFLHEIKGRKINVVSIETAPSSYHIKGEVCIQIDKDLCEFVTVT
jgi:CRISPR-associated protein Cas2